MVSPVLVPDPVLLSHEKEQVPYFFPDTGNQEQRQWLCYLLLRDSFPFCPAVPGKN
jgi:hypothetical protein